MSVYYPKTDMEIIAIDIPDKSLSAFADYQQKEISRREQLAQDRIVILQKAGYDISYDEVAYDHNGNKRIQIRRPHFTDILLKKGYIKDADEAYNKIFADGGICDISNKALSVDKMIRFIHENNAKAILAHPIHTLHTGKKLFQLLQKLKKLGLDGIEVFHSSQSQELRKEYLEMITELKMITTGGSDFHGGSAHPENKLGTGCENNLNIPYLVLEQLRKKRAPSKTYYNELKKYL